MQITPIRTRLFLEDEALGEFICEHIQNIPERSILILASKIVALSEGRSRRIKSAEEKDDLVKKESSHAVRTKHVWLTIKDGAIMANAGIDESNVPDKKVLLLPENSFASAKKIRDTLRNKFSLKELGILIIDSRPLPLRAGVNDFALAYAGFSGIREYRGKPDLFGRTLTMTRTNIADGLAAAAGVLMGEGSEQQPLGLIIDSPVTFLEDTPSNELLIPFQEDMYYPLFKNLDSDILGTGGTNPWEHKK